MRCLGVEFQLPLHDRLADNVLACKGRERRQIRQAHVEICAALARNRRRRQSRRVQRSVQRNQSMRGGHIQGQRGRIEPYRCIDRHRRVLQQLRFESRYPHTAGQRVQLGHTGVGRQIGVEAGKLSTPRQPQLVSLHMRVGVRSLDAAMPAPPDADTPPGKIRPRRRRRRIEGKFEIRRQIVHVQGALRTAMQGAGIKGQVESLRGAQPAQIHRCRQRAQARHLQQILQRSAGRLVQIQRRIHPFRIEAQLQIIIPLAVDAPRRGADHHVQHGTQMGIAAHPQRRGSAGKLRSEIEQVDGDACRIDVRN